MNWDELESERKHTGANAQDVIDLLQQIRDKLVALEERNDRLSEKTERAAAHLPEWEIEVVAQNTDARGYADGPDTTSPGMGWEPFAVSGGSIYWRRRVK